jgi:multiple sugar transport system substrate-binding protein
MNGLDRRGFLRWAMRLSAGMGSAMLLAACQRQVVQIEKIVEKQVTKVVKEVVRETVIVAGTPQVIEKTVEVEKLVTPIPAVKGKMVIVADVLDYGWTHFAVLKSAAFEELFPSILIQWRSLSGWHEYASKIAALYASGQPGDLLEGPPGVLLAQWADQGIIRPLDEIIAADGFDSSGMFGGALAACRYGNQRIALPYLGHAGENLLLYNKRLFDGAALEHPNPSWTLDDLREAALALTVDRNGDRKLEQFGLAERYSLPGAYPVLHLFGGKLFSASGKECALNNAAGVEYLRWAQQTVYGNQVAPSPAQIEEGVVAMLQAGTLAMTRHSFRTFAELATPGEPQDIAATVFPKHPKTGKVGTSASAMAYCISKSSAVASEAFQWIKFLSSREMGVQMFLGGYADPGCRVASWKDPRVLELYPLCAQVADAADAAEVEPLPWNLRLAPCLDAWNRGVERLALGERKPEECAARISDEITKVLETQ